MKKSLLWTLHFPLVFSLCFCYANAPFAKPYYLGADLSYVNEMEDCGAIYYAQNKPVDPFQLFASKGANLVRVRLWHNPDWTQYSTLTDVIKTLSRAQAQGLPVLLDFHYSDTWADPERQEIPAAWSHITDTTKLGEKLYQYTFDTLQTLADKKLLPAMVQVGNEINAEILQPKNQTRTDIINWQRNAELINQGIKAVRDFSVHSKQPIKIVLHIAQPENALWWFAQAQQQGINDYDIIGLSYYPQWSDFTIAQLPQAVRQLKNTYNKEVLVVETGYPWSLKNFDSAVNVLDKKSTLSEFPATPAGQLAYLSELGRAIKSADGLGVIYWEPAWISTDCKTRWGRGSHWENASFFNAEDSNNALPAFLFYSEQHQPESRTTSGSSSFNKRPDQESADTLED